MSNQWASDQQSVRYTSAMRRIGVYRRAIKELQRAYDHKRATTRILEMENSCLVLENSALRKELRNIGQALKCAKQHCSAPATIGAYCSSCATGVETVTPPSNSFTIFVMGVTVATIIFLASVVFL